MSVAEASRGQGNYHWRGEGGSPPQPGTIGLYHVGLRYPSRTAIADALRRLLDHEVPLEGAADHGVSEAIYLRDPDGNGLELYYDRPEEQWSRDEHRNLTMFTRPLELDDLLAAS